MSLSRAVPSPRHQLPTKESRLLLLQRPEPPLGTRSSASAPKRIGVVGNHLPRRCGIATFTTDLCNALETSYGTTQLLAVPVTDADFNYAYPPRVQFELQEGDFSSYQRARDFLNKRRPDVVCLQHEFGIFGGSAGSYVLTLLRGLDMPAVTTLHTVLREPNADQRCVMEGIADLSARLVVMSRHSSRLLREVFRVPESKIDVIHHGVPDLTFAESADYKAEFSLAGKTVLLSFGLLSPNKGIENIIAALPSIVSQNRETILLIVGATHPHLVRQEGDAYRRRLQTMAEELGVKKHVRFHHHFVTPEEMARFIGAADVYITAYRHEAQASSGTLAYALGAGKAIISTPYWHASELLSDGRGALVPFADHDALAAKVIELHQNTQLSYAMRRRAYLYARTMIWENVARQYMRTFQRAREASRTFSSHSRSSATQKVQVGTTRHHASLQDVPLGFSGN